MSPQDFVSQFSPIESPIKGVRLPTLKIESRHKKDAGVAEDCSNFNFLRALCMRGFRALNLKKGSKDYTDYAERTKKELAILDELGFTDYVLLVWDVLNFCRENNIPTGAGRGSSAGSLVLFLIGVTKIDSLKYGLYFERFVSKSRAKKTIIDGITYLDGALCPDVDVDIDYYQRHKVLSYVEGKYRGKTCKILTLNSLSSKLCIKEVGKVLGMKSEEEMTEVTSMIPKLHGIVKEMSEAYEESDDFRNWCNENDLVYQNAQKLCGLVKNKGVHPSGVLVSFDELELCCPTEMSSDKEAVSGYDMNWVSAFAVKLDILGLRSVSVIDDCCKTLGIEAQNINPEDLSIYRSLQDLKNPHGLFQIEADVNYKVAQKVKPKNLEELSAVLSLGRPGAMQFIDQYASFTNTGTIDMSSGSDVLDKILAETGGCCLFQETIMRCCKEVFGLTLDEAELVRRACGKKKKDEMAKFEKIIKENARELNIEKAGEFFWQLMLDSADYSFNKCAFEEDKVVEEKRGEIMLKDVLVGDRIKAFDTLSRHSHFVDVLDVIRGEEALYEVEARCGKIHTISSRHKLLCSDGKMRSLAIIAGDGYDVFVDKGGVTLPQEIVSIKEVGTKKTVDLEVNHSDHNFYCNGFVTSNSHAVAYATLSAQTIFLKFNHPIEFYLSLLKMTRHEPDPIGEISKISKEMSAFGVELLPPSLTKSQATFSIEGKGIRFGLSSIRGISEKTIEKLNNFKREHANKLELFQCAKEAGLGIGVLSALIQAGTLDCLSDNRVLMVYEAQLWNLLTDKEKKLVSAYANRYEYSVPKTIKAFVDEVKDEKSRPLIKASRFATIKKHSEKYKLIYNQNKTSQDFANWYYAQKLTGYTSGKKLIDIFISKKKTLKPISEIKEYSPKRRCEFIGRIEELKTGKSKAGNAYAKFLVSDEGGTLKVMIFKDKLEECKVLNNGLPKEGDIIIAVGTKMDEDCVFADLVATQQNIIYDGLADLKDVK